MLYFYVLLFLLLMVVFVLNLQFRFFYPPGKKLRILEYHSVSNNGFEDQITISRDKLRQHFDYLKQNNYTTLWLSEVEAYEKQKKSLPAKSVVLTFDDGFLDNYTELFPMLQEYGFKAVCFVVLGRVGGNIDWTGLYIKEDSRLINAAQMSEMATHFEYGYHTYKHDNYAKLTFEEIEKDLQLCQEAILREKLNVFPALAYTYGRYFRKKDEKQKQFFALLEKYGIKYGLRIGNRINAFPFSSKYEIQRIDIRGNEPFKVFKRRLLLGRKKLF